VHGVRKVGVGVTGLVVAVGLFLGLASPARALTAAKPVVTAVSPAHGSTVGGTTVTIRGAHFTLAGKSLVKAVKFGTVAGTHIHVRSSISLTVRAPKGKGTVNVRVITKGGTSRVAKADRYAYKGAGPVVAGVSPSYGSTTGGTVVTIAGGGFTGATAVTFGGVEATSFKVAPGGAAITAITPAHTEVGDPFDVRVTTPRGTSTVSPADRFFFYVPATVTSVSPGNGPRGGSIAVTITGTNLYSARSVAQAVKFGNALATAVVVKSSSTIQATAPAGTGTVNVTVTTLAGTTATSSADQFSYAANIAPASTSLPSQSQVVGAAVGTPPSVVVTDALGHPVQRVSVSFAVAGGGGSATGTTVVTNVSGIATVGGWTLGAVAGLNTLTATAAGLTGSPVTFNATGLADVNTAHIAAYTAGSVQTATAGGPVTTLPSVIVTDSNKNPVPNVSITFAVGPNSGTATGTTVLTDTLGIARVGSWTLGPKAGTNTLTASGANLAGSPVTFTANGTVGAAAAIALNDGNNQTVAAGTPVGTLPSVLVTDAYGNHVGAGVSVTFAVTAGGGSATGTATTTGPTGIATVGTWMLGVAPGQNTLQATADGLSGSPVIFSATGAVGAAATIALNGGDGQTADAGAQLAISPSVLVTDSVGNHVGAGVSVTFAVTAGGGSVATPNAVTNGSGIATAGKWTLGGTAGSNALQATSGSLSGSPVTFHATGTVGPATTMTLNAGDGQQAAAGMRVATDPSVLVTDAYGNPVPGVAVAFAVDPGGGSTTAASATTDTSGIATVGWYLGDPGTNTLTATADGLAGSPVTFTATGT
jgi:hypothetical protein